MPLSRILQLQLRALGIPHGENLHRPSQSCSLILSRVGSLHLGTGRWIVGGIVLGLGKRFVFAEAVLVVLGLGKWVGFFEATALLLGIFLSGVCGFIGGGCNVKLVRVRRYGDFLMMCSRGIGGVGSLKEHGFPCLEDVGGEVLLFLLACFVSGRRCFLT
ncbi:unnamed protein product [Linum trigynum]|uniref:Uncharacterized protein n=1 Tax=Linum trigynum TaxID=586398 RepID=A0AAV2F4G7_9ROSI